MAETNETIGSDELVVIVEMGDDFEPGARTAAALAELAAALEEEHGDDVTGFASPKIEPVRSFAFINPAASQAFMEGWPAKWKVGTVELGARFDGKGNDQ